jgi:tetratricopeptide (TPR) repeat protein
VYLASCGFFLAVGAVVGRLAALEETEADRRRRPALMVALCAVLAVLSGLTVSRNRVWADPVRLWADAVRKAPLTVEPYYGLAYAYRTTGDHTAAEATYQRAIALRPGLSQGYLGLAGNLLDVGRVESAEEVLRLAILRVPADPRARLQLAALEEESFHDASEALRLCREALVIKPDLVEAQECIRRNEGKLSGSPPR